MKQNNSPQGWTDIILGKQSENTQRCKECGDLVKFCGPLNNEDQCSECSLICEACGISQNSEPIVDGLCRSCK